MWTENIETERIPQRAKDKERKEATVFHQGSTASHLQETEVTASQDSRWSVKTLELKYLLVVKDTVCTGNVMKSPSWAVRLEIHNIWLVPLWTVLLYSYTRWHHCHIAHRPGPAAHSWLHHFSFSVPEQIGCCERMIAGILPKRFQEQTLLCLFVFSINTVLNYSNTVEHFVKLAFIYFDYLTL